MNQPRTATSVLPAHIGELQLLSREDLTDAPEVTDTQAAINRALNKGPRRARPARKGLLGISEATLDRMLLRGTFPKPMRIGPRMVRWSRQVVCTWLDEQQSEVA